MRQEIKKFIPQLNSKDSNILFALSLLMLSMAVFLFLGADGYLIANDSESYMQLQNRQGVMPLYPLFLFFNRLLWGNERYLDYVIVEQALIAAFCILWLVLKIKKRFSLKFWEAYVVYLLALLPFTVDMPLAMTTQEIVTEGLAYALFYVFAVFLLDALWDKSYRRLLYSWLFVFVLGLLRSQLQMLFGVCSVALLYIVFMKFRQKSRMALLGSMLITFVICVCLIGIGVLGVVRINSFSQRMMYGGTRLARLIQDNAINIEPESAPEQDETVESEEMTYEITEAEVVDSMAETTEAEPAPPPNTHPEVLAYLEQGYEDSGAAISQFDTLIFSKGMYEADYEDYLLFEDEQLQEQFLLLYDIVDKLEYRYPYADSGLMGFRHISDAVGAIGVASLGSLDKYFVEYYNTTISYFVYQKTSRAARTIGLKLLTHHFGRFVWHTIRLSLPAFVASVFFQKERFYLLCSLITLFLYVTAIGLTIWSYVDQKADRRYGELMLGVLITDFVLVMALSLLFIGLQRYVVYAFGLFYIAYFLLLRQLWQIHGKRWFGKYIGSRPYGV